MGEHLADALLKTADVLHWLGRFEQCNALIFASRLCRAKNLRDLNDLQGYVEMVEAGGPSEPTGSADK